MTNPSNADVITTCDELYLRFVNDNWAARLKQQSVSCTTDTIEYDAPEKEYRKRVLTRYYENNVQIAFTIDYYMWDASRSRRRVKMLLVEGIRHLCP
jgi:hypothetical protein